MFTKIVGGHVILVDMFGPPKFDVFLYMFRGIFFA